MKDRRRPAAHISHERWLVSYADFVTLLFAFFVVLYASAQVDRNKAERLSNAIESAFQQLGVFSEERAHPSSLPGSVRPFSDAEAGSDAPPRSLARVSEANTNRQDLLRRPEDLDKIRAELEKALAAEIKRNDVALRMGPDGLIVSLREVGFFDSGSANLKPGAERAFARVALILQEHRCAVRIEGHTDNVPIHTAQFASNWELSTARATDLVKSLIESHGISPDRLAAAGYAEFHPVAGNDSAKGRQLNRRVDLIILNVVPNSPVPADGTPSSPGVVRQSEKTTSGSTDSAMANSSTPQPSSVARF